VSKTKKTYYAILGLLSLRPMSGYDMKKYVDEALSHFWKENYGYIYPTLARLAKDGMVSCRTIRQQGKPSRRLYSLTRRGKAELLKWLEEPVDQIPTRNEMLLKISFASNISTDALIGILEQYIEDQKRKLKEYRSVQAEIDREMDAVGDEAELRNWRYIVRFGTSVVPSRIRWAREVLRDLRSSLV
jgi:DNA-binding PadR family transcriptional regulator